MAASRFPVKFGWLARTGRYEGLQRHWPGSRYIRSSMRWPGYPVGRPAHLGIASDPHGIRVAPGLIGLIARTAPEKAVICEGAAKNCRRAAQLAGWPVFNRRIDRLRK